MVTPGAVVIVTKIVTPLMMRHCSRPFWPALYIHAYEVSDICAFQKSKYTKGQVE